MQRQHGHIQVRRATGKSLHVFATIVGLNCNDVSLAASLSAGSHDPACLVRVGAPVACVLGYEFDEPVGGASGAFLIHC